MVSHNVSFSYVLGFFVITSPALSFLLVVVVRSWGLLLKVMEDLLMLHAKREKREEIYQHKMAKDSQSNHCKNLWFAYVAKVFSSLPFCRSSWDLFCGLEELDFINAYWPKTLNQTISIKYLFASLPACNFGKPTLGFLRSQICENSQWNPCKNNWCWSAVKANQLDLFRSILVFYVSLHSRKVLWVQFMNVCPKSSFCCQPCFTWGFEE